jgi:hypothetical protein
VSDFQLPTLRITAPTRELADHLQGLIERALEEASSGSVWLACGGIQKAPHGYQISCTIAPRIGEELHLPTQEKEASHELE